MIQTDSTLYRFLVWAAVASVVLVLATIVSQYLTAEDDLAEINYRRGNLRLEDGEFAQALTEFDIHIQQNPTNPAAFLGRGLALMGLGAFRDAMQALDAAMALKPDFAAAYANRGILHDKMGKPELALRDYKKALQLDETMADGPDWLTRFFRNQYDAPTSIADRARYLEKELRKPSSQRLLTVPELDEKERSYKVEGRL